MRKPGSRFVIKLKVSREIHRQCLPGKLRMALTQALQRLKQKLGRNINREIRSWIQNWEEALCLSAISRAQIDQDCFCWDKPSDFGRG